jgi:tRNA1(Val) A37 N6-methylase TrmN6
LLSTIEQTRLRVSKSTDAEKKSKLGQFLTPVKTAVFMAGLFPEATGDCCLLDAGAGIGSLSSAFLERCIKNELFFNEIQLKAFELDENIHEDLHRSLCGFGNKLPISFEIIGGDFIELAVNKIQFGQEEYTHAILNPPYKKIGSNSHSRLLLRQVGIETVNLYSAFIALSLLLMKIGGQIVAIIPRSFCNGPYYRPFREFLLNRSAIRQIHLFGSRSKTFKDDKVLQENIIIRLERGGQQDSVMISTSTDDTFTDLACYNLTFDKIVFPNDPQRFIHIPTSRNSSIESSSNIRNTLSDLGIKVSTGPVVDFRLKAYLRNMPEIGTVPLLYPNHFSNGNAIWPQIECKKPNAILHNDVTGKWLYQNGFYCVVRRFSSKEEKRRIVASVVDPSTFNNSTMLGFENHLNVFHDNKHGLPKALAHGLAVYLNMTAVDEHFRRYSGHTQVNATDLMRMKYPCRENLIALGEWAMQYRELTQTMIDDKSEILTV